MTKTRIALLAGAALAAFAVYTLNDKGRQIADEFARAFTLSAEDFDWIPRPPFGHKVVTPDGVEVRVNAQASWDDLLSSYLAEVDAYVAAEAR